MPHAIEASTLRILKSTGETVGTGFLVSKNLAVTCAHVVKILGASAGDTIDIRFTGKSAATTARLLPEYWRPDDLTDIAILEVHEVPVGIFPLRMGRASESRLKNDLYTFGYAIAADEQGIGGLGTFITLKPEGNFIQFRMHEANHGHSGAPIYDDQRGVVVGMIKKGHTGTGRNAETTFAIPTETIWQVCPDLRPVIPPLPRRNPIVEGINLLPYDYDQRIQNFLTEYLGTDAHPVPFGGRDEALKMLDAWLAESIPYLLLAAPAGRGKSALLVRWLDSLKARDDLALAFVPVSIRFGTNMERVFYAALAARLAFLHGNDVPASPETSTAVYRGLVSDYLSKPLANGRTLLVVLDGLDEAADWRIKADFMPAELPAGVRVVVSARFLAGDADSIPWLRRLNWERNGLASAPFLTPLDQEGVRDVLFKMDTPLDELSRKVDIVAELYRLSEGDPLLVGLYVGDLWAKGYEVTRLKPEDLTGIEPGYKGYFDQWWDDQKELWGKQKPWMEQHVRTVRSLLAGALGPLFKDDVQALAPELEADYLDDALEVLRRFIIGDSKIQGYTFSHPKLGQYFWETLSEVEQTQWEGRFLSWGEQTLEELIEGKRSTNKKKIGIPFYVVSSYSAHLTRAKQPIEKWLPFIHSQQWAQAWFIVEGAYGGYLQDVQRVWEQCKLLDQQSVETEMKAFYMGRQIRCALLEASLHSSAGNVLPKLIWPLVRDMVWTWPQAWVVIRQMPDSEKKAKAIIALFPHITDKHLTEALFVARAIQTAGDRASALSAMAQRLPEVAGEALEAARAIQDEASRANVLNELAQRLPERELGQVLEATRALRVKDRANVLSSLAQRLPEVTGEALEAVRAMLDDESRARVLSELSQHLPEVELGQVLEAARALGVNGRASVLSSLMQRLPEVTEEALEVAKEALEAAQAIWWDEYPRASALCVLVRHLPEVADEALEAARAVKNELSRADVLIALAQRLPEGKLGKVLEAAQAIRHEMSRADVLSELAQRMPERELGQVLEAARAMQAQNDRTCVLIALAQRLPDVAEEALEAARAIQDEGSRASVLIALAQHMPEGELGQMLEAVQVIPHEYSRARALSALAQRLPERELGQVLGAARAIQDEGYCANVLIVLAQRLPDGELGQVLEAARAIPHEYSRARALSALAQRLPETAGEALEAVREIQDEKSRACLLSEMAQRLPLSAGELGQVLEAARTILDEGSRASMLNELAQRLPEDKLGQVLDAACMIQYEEPLANVLIALAQRMPEEKLGQVLEAAWAIPDGYYLARVLSALAQRLPERELGKVLKATQEMRNEWHRAEPLIVLAQRIPEGKLRQVLEAARAIRFEWRRAKVLSALAQRLPEVAREVLAITRAIQNEDNFRAEVLSTLAQRIPEGELGLVLEAARAVQSAGDRASVLGALAQRLPEVAGEALAAARAIRNEKDRARMLSDMAQSLPERQLVLVLEAAREIQNEYDRTPVLSDLAQRLPLSAGVLGQALKAARTIQFEEYRARVLSALAQPMMKLSHEKSLLLMGTTLAELSHRTRVNLYSDLAALMPVIIHIGTEDTPREIYEAVRDVTTWWP